MTKKLIDLSGTNFPSSDQYEVEVVQGNFFTNSIQSELSLKLLVEIMKEKEIFGVILPQTIAARKTEPLLLKSGLSVVYIDEGELLILDAEMVDIKGEKDTDEEESSSNGRTITGSEAIGSILSSFTKAVRQAQREGDERRAKLKEQESKEKSKSEKVETQDPSESTEQTTNVAEAFAKAGVDGSKKGKK